MPAPDEPSDSRIALAKMNARCVLSAHTIAAHNLSAWKTRPPFIDFHFSARRIMWIQIAARVENISSVDVFSTRHHKR
jgi:hypothetical protein